MELEAARIYAIELMTEHKLIADGWTFDFNRRRSSIGFARLKSKRIQVTELFVVAAPREEFRQVMLHEIAHALQMYVGNHLHTDAWLAEARAIGYIHGRYGWKSLRTFYIARRNKRRPRKFEPRFTKGDVVRDGQGGAGVIYFVARHRYWIRYADGHGWAIPFDSAIRLGSVPSRILGLITKPALRIGDRIDQPWENGVSGPIIKIFRTCYLIVDDSDGLMYKVYFEEAEPVDRQKKISQAISRAAWQPPRIGSVNGAARRRLPRRIKAHAANRLRPSARRR